MINPTQAVDLLLDRRKARTNLEWFATRVPIPGVEFSEDDTPTALIETQQAPHHKLMLQALQKCMEARHGRLMILAPPGSAKSTYASVVAPAWYLGTHPGHKIIMASYGDDLARKHGRRTRQLLGAKATQAILQCQVKDDSRAVDDFALSNNSEYIAKGILSGVTGNRGHGIILDDPVKGREAADSQIIRERSWDAYQDDLLTRLVPGGWVTIITTRWHEDDITGRLLPESWAGESGEILCRDGNTWNVLCFQAQCATVSDPLGRKMGEMLWPEWFDERHWSQFRLNARTWSSLYQQRPAPDEGIHFRKADMALYDVVPQGLRILAASDNAVTPDGGDWTEMGIAGLAPDGALYLLDWWRGRVGSDVWVEKQIDMIAQWQPLAWFGESGPIRRATEGFLRRRMTQRDVNCRLEYLPSVSDKLTMAQAAIALSGSGRLFWPKAAWVAEVQRQCLSFPAGKPDDAVDTLGLLARGMATFGKRQEHTYDYTRSAAQGMVI